MTLIFKGVAPIYLFKEPPDEAKSQIPISGSTTSRWSWELILGGFVGYMILVDWQNMSFELLRKVSLRKFLA